MEPEESLEIGLLAHLSLPSTVWDASRTSQLSLVWAVSATWLQAAAWPCPLLSLLLWPTCLPRMALPMDLMGMPSPPTLTNGIDNVTCEDKDVSKVRVCLWIKYTKLPGQHLPKIIMLQKVTISQIKQLLQNYKETWHKAGVRLKNSIKDAGRLLTGGRDLGGETAFSKVWGSANNL